MEINQKPAFQLSKGHHLWKYSLMFTPNQMISQKWKEGSWNNGYAQLAFHDRVNSICAQLDWQWPPEVAFRLLTSVNLSHQTSSNDLSLGVPIRINRVWNVHVCFLIKKHSYIYGEAIRQDISHEFWISVSNGPLNTCTWILGEKLEIQHVQNQTPQLPLQTFHQ